MQISTRLKELRTARDVSAAELAGRVGVTRQTIYAIEGGRFVPNTAVSLRLARALAVAVEEIFSLTETQSGKPISADLLAASDASEGQLARFCQVKGRLVATPVPVFPIYLPTADGIIVGRKKGAALIESSCQAPDMGNRLLLAGCDPALSLLNEALRSSAMEVITVPCASQCALQWLKDGRVHVAGTHLLDRATGDYNLPIIRRLLPRTAARVVTFATWEAGLITARGNPKSIRSIADLGNKKVRLVNRETGSGSRDLLDAGLRQFSIPFDKVNGYSSNAPGHLAAAYGVATGSADCCVATHSAARCFGLDFIPLTVERFDLSFTPEALELPAAKALLDALNRSSLRKKLESIAGYDTAHTGEVLM